MTETDTGAADRTTDETVTLGVAIVEAIASNRGVDPTELGFHLADVIDPDVLETLDGQDGNDWQLQFSADGHRISVDHERVITIDGRVVR